MSILITGRSGTGKSTLIDGLFGVPGKAVSRSSTVEGLSDDTSLTASKLEANGITARTIFWNSPGVRGSKLDDATTTAMTTSNSYNKIKELYGSVDLILYVMRMDETRMRPEDGEIMRKLTRFFGTSFWRRSLFVLTFGNRVGYLDAQQIMQRSKEHSAKRARQWEEHVHSVLRDEGVPESMLRGIPFVPAGHPLEQQLFSGQDPWRDSLMQRILAVVDYEVKRMLLKMYSPSH